jgi:hypothetical protein
MRPKLFVSLVVVTSLTVGTGTLSTRGQTPESPRKMAVVELFTSHG